MSDIMFWGVVLLIGFGLFWVIQKKFSSESQKSLRETLNGFEDRQAAERLESKRLSIKWAEENLAAFQKEMESTLRNEAQAGRAHFSFNVYVWNFHGNGDTKDPEISFAEASSLRGVQSILAQAKRLDVSFSLNESDISVYNDRNGDRIPCKGYVLKFDISKPYSSA